MVTPTPSRTEIRTKRRFLRGVLAALAAAAAPVQCQARVPSDWVEIDGFNPAVVLLKHRCELGGQTTDCADYQFSFQLRNFDQLPVRNIGRVELGVGSLSVIRQNLNCENPQFQVRPNEASTGILIQLSADGDGTLTFACADDLRPDTTARLIPRGPMPYSGVATLRLSGVMQDGTPWAAQASAPIADQSL